MVNRPAGHNLWESHFFTSIGLWPILCNFCVIFGLPLPAKPCPEGKFTVHDVRCRIFYLPGAQRRDDFRVSVIKYAVFRPGVRAGRGAGGRKNPGPMNEPVWTVPIRAAA